MPTDAAKDAQTSPAGAAAPATDDLEAARKAVEDTAAIGGGLWLSYLFVLLYLAIAAGAVTHADLLLQAPVKAPFLNIDLPLLAFFFLAPLLLLLTHAYTLVHLYFLARRVDQFNTIEGLTEAWRRRLPSNIFVQFLGAPEEDRYGAFGLLLGAILWVTLVVAPIALFLLLEIQFLPYHSRWITWTIRIALFLDLGLLWWLWRKILASRTRSPRARAWKTVAKMTAGALLTPLVVLFACGVATFPGEWQEKYVTVPWLFSGDVDPVLRRPKSYFANTLILPEFNLYEALKIDDPKRVAWKEHLIDLYDRDLRQAVLPRAILAKADLRFAQLQGASLLGAQLQGAALDHAQLQGASLFGAQLQGADLDGAHLQGASLNGAQLQGASLYEAQLQGAMLFAAKLQGADLDEAQLQGADLNGAQLQGASLFTAQLQGASLFAAQLRGASLYEAQLQGASLTGVDLQGASLDGAGLWRAQLSNSVAKDLFVPAGSPDWNPKTFRQETFIQAWTDATYAALRQSIERAVPKGRYRDEALKRVAGLDCARKGDSLASCDPAAEPPDSVKAWKNMIEAATVDQGAYGKALAAILGSLVCTNEADRIYVLRGLLRFDRFRKTGAEMPALAKRIMSPECSVSAALTDADKTRITEVVKTAVASSNFP